MRAKKASKATQERAEGGKAGPESTAAGEAAEERLEADRAGAEESIEAGKTIEGSDVTKADAESIGVDGSIGGLRSCMRPHLHGCD